MQAPVGHLWHLWSTCVSPVGHLCVIALGCLGESHHSGPSLVHGVVYPEPRRCRAQRRPPPGPQHIGPPCRGAGTRTSRLGVLRGLAQTPWWQLRNQPPSSQCRQPRGAQDP